MKKVWIVVIIILALGIIGGGVYFLVNHNNVNNDVNNVNVQSAKNNIALSDIKSIKITPSVTALDSFSEYEITDQTEIAKIIKMFNGMKKSDEYLGTSAFLSVSIQLNNGDYYNVYELDPEKNMVTVGYTKANGEYSQGVYISKDFSDYLNNLKEKLRK